MTALPDTLPFDRAEYAQRLTKTRSAMAKAGIDLLFTTDPSNMAWLTGYNGWSFYVHQGVLVFPDADPIWWGRMQDGNGARRTVWMADDRLAPYAEHYVQTPQRHPMQDLAERLLDLGQGRARIGVEMDNYYYSAKAHQTLQTSLPEASLIDATGLINWQRAVKSPAELDYMQRAARISDRVMAHALDRVEPGIPKNEIVAQILHDLAMGADGHWGDYPAIVPLLPSGADASAPHLTWDGRAFASGEATFFEVSGCYRRYHAPFCRTVFLGQPPDDILRAEAALIEGLEAGLQAARPGARACDVAEALGQALEKAGIERGARCGYPIGLSYPPDWGERTISFRAEDDTILQPGMTFHFMPGLWMDDWGLEITESIQIMESGPARPFCQTPRPLRVKP